MPEYILENKSDEIRAQELIKEKIGVDVSVKINKENGNIRILSQEELDELILEQIQLLLKEFGYL